MTTPTQQNMPDIVYIFNSPTSIGDLGLTVTHEKDDHVAYHADHVLTALKEQCDFIQQEKLDAMAGREQYKRERDAIQSKYAALKEVADGMKSFIEQERNAIFYAMTRGQQYDIGLAKERMTQQITAYQAHKEESDGV